MIKIELSEEQIKYLLDVVEQDLEDYSMCGHVSQEKDCHYCNVGDVPLIHSTKKLLKERLNHDKD